MKPPAEEGRGQASEGITSARDSVAPTSELSAQDRTGSPQSNRVRDGARRTSSDALSSVQQVAFDLYIPLGLPVFALEPNEKRPHSIASPHGFKDATLDPEAVRRWPVPCNLGVAPVANVLVLDIDVAKDDRPLGVRRQEALDRRRFIERTFSEAAAAPLARTPSGGWHIWLRLRPDAPHLTCGSFPATGGERWGELRGMGRSYLAVWPSTVTE